MLRFFYIFLFKDIDGHINNVADSSGECLQLFQCLWRKCLFLLLHLSCRIYQINGMIWDSLEITDTVHQHCHFLGILLTQVTAGKLHKITTDFIVILIYQILLEFHICCNFLIKCNEQSHCFLKGSLGNLCHLHNIRICLFQSKGRSIEETLIHPDKIFLLLCLLAFFFVHLDYHIG